MSTDTSASPIDFSDPDFLVGDRTESYRVLRDAGTVQWPQNERTWVLSRHRDIREVLRINTARVQPEGTTAPPWLDDGPARDRLRANLVQVDKPDHTRLRKAVSPLFIPRRVAQFRQTAADSVARALSRVPNGEIIDAVEHVAVDIPRGVICGFLGMPEGDWVKLTQDQHDFLMIFSPVPLDDSQKTRLDAITAFYLDYFDTFLRSRPAEAHSPYVRLLLEAEARGELSHTEVLSMTHTVLDAGYETTRTSIANIVEILATRPDVLDALRAEPELIGSATEELLRFATPLHVRERYLTQSFVTSDGIELPPGAHVILMLGAANRDEEAFDQPDTIDLERANANLHQAFGGGMHHCLGAPIARIQIQETLRGLVERFESIELSERGTRFPDLIFPALTTLPVVARQSRAA